jgi:hypothetical protein
MMKRSGRFYRKNEEEVMRSLGLKHTKGSGSGWIEKEDGQSENVICQLKSTDASSIRFKLEDWQTLEYNAGVSKKLPVFALQFLQTNDVFLLVRPDDLKAAARLLETGDYNAPETVCDVGDGEAQMTSEKTSRVIAEAAGYITTGLTFSNAMVSTAKSARDAYMQEQEAKWRKEKSAL